MLKPIYTKRLLLKQISLNDAEDLYEYGKDPIIGYNAGWFPHKSIKETKQIIKAMIESNEVYGIYLDKKLIGTVGIHPSSSGNNSLGYALNRTYWHNGYMTEAVRAILEHYFKDHEVIFATTFTNNIRSQHLLKKVGFKFIVEKEKESLDTIKAIFIFELKKEDFIKEN